MLDSHNVSAPPILGFSAVLAHFKFAPGIDEKITDAMSRHHHPISSVEFYFLDAMIRHFADASLLCEASRRYQSPQSLKDAGYF